MVQSHNNRSVMHKLLHMAHVEKWIGFVLGILVLVATLVTDPPSTMSVNAWKCTGLGTLMAIWWATEAIPIPATSLMPIVLIPALDLGTLKSATAPYANPTVYLFFGGFLLGLAMEKCNLHKRIALTILNKVGISPKRQIAGFMVATAFLSMWVSNTATAVMMAPIGISVATMLSQGANEKDANHFEVMLLLSIAYAASIGGIATLIGTPPNALLRAFLEEHYNVSLGFGQWMLLGVPVSLVMLVATFLWLTRGTFKLGNEGKESESYVREELRKLGPVSYAEKLVCIIFGTAAVCWIIQPVLKQYIPFISDTFIAMAASLILFCMPADFRKREFLMDWQSTSRMPWGILLLFGGGLALAGVINSSTLAHWLAEQLNMFSGVDLVIMIVIISTLIIFLTEITSNTATAAAFLPLVGAMAVAQGVPPQFFAVPAAIAASCAFMLPVATPPNAIVFGAGNMPISAMIRAGLALNIFSIIIITVFCFFFMETIIPATHIPAV